jgi:hypothetical protein
MCVTARPNPSRGETESVGYRCREEGAILE